MDTAQIEFLKQALGETVRCSVTQTLKGLGIYGGQDSTCASPFPLRTARQVGTLFGVSVHTVRSWVRQGELHPRYQVLSGRACRLIFTQPDLIAFFDRNFPSLDDLGHPNNPRSRKGALIEKMLRMNRLYVRRRQRTD